MMRFPGGKYSRIWTAAACILLGGAARPPVLAVTLDFESAAYVPGLTISAVDGWLLSSIEGGLPDAFRTVAETGGNKVLRVASAGLNTVFKDIPGSSSGLQHLDLQWTWRASDRTADVCLGASSAIDNARSGARALACFHPSGKVTLATAQGGETVAAGVWTVGVRFAMRMRMNLAENTYSLYMATDSLRSDEMLVAGPVKMAGNAADAPARLVLRSEDGIGTVDVDDIAWENVVYWLGGGDGLAGTARNWSGGAVPDSQTQVVFDARAVGGIAFDRAYAFRSLTVDKTYVHGLNLGAHSLSLTGRGDFTGLKSFLAAGGSVRMASPRAQSLIGPEATAMPPVLHDVSGVLRLDARPLLVHALTQTAGTLDLNNMNITVAGALRIQNGGAASVRGLAGRNLTVGGSARFEGSSGALLSLRGAQLWTLTAGDTLAASRVELENSKVQSGQGYATESSDKGGNLNWIFLAAGAPLIKTQPKARSFLVGETGTLKVSVDGGGHPLGFQWMKGDSVLKDQTDSVFTRPALALADNGSYACEISNAYGTVLSQAAALTVAFPAPTATPESASFTDSQVVRIASPVASASLFVSLNNAAPVLLTRDLVLKATTSVKAFAVLGKDTSKAGSWQYTRTALQKPTALPAGGSFADSVVVVLAPPASSPAAAIRYRVNGGAMAAYQAPFTLRESAVVKAVAALGSAVSDTGAWTFSRRLEAPSATPRGRTFPDTLRIALGARTPDTRIYYTLDGRTPDTASALYRGPFLVDSSVVLTAVSAKDGALSAEALTEIYELVPDSISASPRGGDYPAGITITLASTSRRAELYYTLDGSPPGPPGPEYPTSRRYAGGFRLENNAMLKAVAVAGQGPALRMGRVITESYTFIAGGARVLGPGQTLDISSRYSISNPGAGAPAVTVDIKDPDSLKGFKEFRGFRDVQFAMVVSLAANAVGFPAGLVFTAPPGEERALYRMTPSGKVVEFVSREAIVNLPGTGTYFLGVDTMPPAIAINGETFVEDSTRIVFTVQDNVSSLTYDLFRSDAPGLNVKSAALGNPGILTLVLKSSAAWAPLGVRLRVRDGRNTRFFPADTAAEYHLSQKSSAPLPTPREFRIGSKPTQPWDMIGFPLETQGKITLGMLKANNTVKGLTARVWDHASGKTRALRDDEPILPGASVWVGSSASAAMLTLPAFQTTARQGKETWQLTLKPGWNQVSNPSLRPLIWPFNRKALDYPNSEVKGLHGFNPVREDSLYFFADTLQPWRGYFVLSKAEKDTVITLRTTPVPLGLAASAAGGQGPVGAGQGAGGGPMKRGLPAPGGVRLVLALDKLSPLQLGATPASVDGLGVEDEPQPPALSERGPGLWSARGRARLGTDFLHWTPGGVHAWRVVATRTGSAEAEAPEGARVEDLLLPEGYALFAVSRSRGLKFSLDQGGVIPLQPGESDSLDVFAGPLSALEARLSEVPASVDVFRLSARPHPGGYLLDLALPAPARLAWSLHTPDGRLLDGETRRLDAGYHVLPRKLSARGSSTVGLLRLDWESEGKSGRLVRKIALP